MVKFPIIRSMLFCCMMFVCASTFSAQRVDSIKAPFYINQDVMICGQVFDVNYFSNRTILNLGGHYPKEHLSIVIWENLLPDVEERFGSLSSLKNKKVCVSGTVTKYKNHLQVKLLNAQFLRLMQ